MSSALTNFVGTRLYSGNSAQIYVGLVILYSTELLSSLCGPVISRLALVLFKMARPTEGVGVDQKPYDFRREKLNDEKKCYFAYLKQK